MQEMVFNEYYSYSENVKKKMVQLFVAQSLCVMVNGDCAANATINVIKPTFMKSVNNNSLYVNTADRLPRAAKRKRIKHEYLAEIGIEMMKTTTLGRFWSSGTRCKSNFT